MKRGKSKYRNQSPSFRAKKEYNAENFNGVNNFSFLEVVDWRK